MAADDFTDALQNVRRDIGRNLRIGRAISETGGEHGDFPLNEHAGKLIGEAVAGMAESCIVALNDLQTKAAERRFMLAFLDAL